MRRLGIWCAAFWAGAVASAAAQAPPAKEAPSGVWERANLLPDPDGVRAALADRGLSFGLQETSEVLGNVTGGVHRGAAYDGVTQLGFGLDTQKAFGWAGGIFNVSAFQIHGRNLSTDNLEVLQTISSVNASRSSRLWELWYQQGFWNGALDIRIGQQSIDQEFSISPAAALFINAAAGWPGLPAVDQYAGGPDYPLSALAVRVRAQPLANVTLLGGVFDDNPPGGPFANDLDVRGAEQSGTRFNLNTGALFIAEAQYALNPAPAEAGAAPAGLPGTYRLGATYDSGTFPDQRRDAAGLSLADPSSTGIARQRRGNTMIYAIADQMVWRPDPKGTRALGIFVRAQGAPADRNLVDVAVNAGATLKSPLPGRDSDIAGLEYGFTHISAAAAALDRDTNSFGGPFTPVRSGEHFLELTYSFQVTPWWVVQPDLQYVFLPGGGIANPAASGKRIGNELVLGLRTNVLF